MVLVETSLSVSVEIHPILYMKKTVFFKKHFSQRDEETGDPQNTALRDFTR